MLKMKGSANELAKLVKIVHNKFHGTNEDLLKVLNDLKKIQREKENAQKLLEMSLTCKEITLLMLQVRKEIESDNHYHAMRIIENIQRELSQNPALLPMKKTLETWLPIAINKLLYAARTDADTFLNDLRSSKMRLIGQTILIKQVKSLIRNDEILGLLKHTLTTGNAGSPSSDFSNFNKVSYQDSHSQRLINNTSTNFNPFTLPGKYSITSRYILQHVQTLYKQVPNNSPYSFFLFPLPINVEECVSGHFEPSMSIPPEGVNLLENNFINDMSSIHKVLHLYAILGNLHNYYDYYSHNRYEVFKTKLIKNFEKSVSSNGLLTSVQIYLEELVGFFMIEIMIYRLVENNSIYFHQKELDKLWEETFSEFQRVCTEFAITLHSPCELIQIKEEIILLLFIILDHNIFYSHWNVSLLLKFISSLWELFDGLQIQSLQQNIFLHLSKASFQPYQINDSNTFFLNIKSYQLDLIEMHDDSFFVSDKYSLPSSPTASFPGNVKNPLSRTNSIVSVKREAISINRLEANLDALEQELGVGTITIPGNSNQLGSGVSLSTSFLGNSHSFLPQTFPFSEFVPLIIKELHSMLTRLLLYGTVPIPDRQNKNFMSEIYKLQSIQSVKFDSLSLDEFSTMNSKLRKDLTDQSREDHSRRFQDQHHHSMKQTIHSSSSLYHSIQDCRFYEKICLSIKSYYHFIATVLNQELSKDGMETILSKAVQIYLDSAAISLATNRFYHHFLVESLIIIFGKENLDFSWIDMIYTDIMSTIRKTINQAQDMVFELLSNKIEVLLESSLMFIELAPEAFSINPNFVSGHQHSLNNLLHSLNLNTFNAFFVHESVESIIEFLKITFMCLTHLPKVIRETVYYVSCYKLSNGIIDYLLSNKVTRINVFGILSLDADCKKFVQFADSCGIMHLKECFDELSQMINALLSPDLASFGEDYYIRNSLYPRLNVHKFANLLEKVRVVIIHSRRWMLTKSQISPSPIIAQSYNLPKFEKNMTRALAKKLRLQPQINRDLSAEILL